MNPMNPDINPAGTSTIPAPSAAPTAPAAATPTIPVFQQKPRFVRTSKKQPAPATAQAPATKR